MPVLADPKDAPPGFGKMVAPASALPDVLPTDRLLAGGKAVPGLRAELRTIPDLRSGLAVALVVAEPIVIVWLAIVFAHPASWIVAFLLMGRQYARFASLGHEAVHRTLFTNKKVNDFVGRWILSYPSWVPFELYRRAHIDHHRDELGPKEPDMALYRAYPITRCKFSPQTRSRRNWPNRPQALQRAGPCSSSSQAASCQDHGLSGRAGCRVLRYWAPGVVCVVVVAPPHHRLAGDQ